VKGPRLGTRDAGRGTRTGQTRRIGQAGQTGRTSRASRNISPVTRHPHPHLHLHPSPFTLTFTLHPSPFTLTSPFTLHPSPFTPGSPMPKPITSQSSLPDGSVARRAGGVRRRAGRRGLLWSALSGHVPLIAALRAGLVEYERLPTRRGNFVTVSGGVRGSGRATVKRLAGRG